MKKAPSKVKPSKAEKEERSSAVQEAMFPYLNNEQDEVPGDTYIKYSISGRPTKYSGTILTKTYQYINNTRDEFFNYQKGFGATDTYERRVMANLPTLEGLALFLNVHRDTVHEWSKKHKSFSDALDLILALQKERLLHRGLSGDYNPMIAKLVLSANHGMKERSDVTTDDKPMPQPIINVHRDDINKAD